MTEREKMIRGEWYDANYDQDLIAERRAAEVLCDKFNSAGTGSEAQAEALNGLLGQDRPERLEILAPVYFDYINRTHFGTGCFVNHGCYFMDGGSIFIGDNVFIGPFCGFYTATHPFRYEDRNKGLELSEFGKADNFER